MTTAQAIAERVLALPKDAQQEVLDFVEFIETRQNKLLKNLEDASWSSLSLTSAMRGLEEEEVLYSLADLKEGY